jgi:hypothetical protein
MAVVGLALLVSCSFPDVELAAAGEAGGGGEGGTGEASAEGSADSSSGTDAALVEATTRTDAETKIDAAGCTSCDCDKDGFFPLGSGCDGGPGPVPDCDDADELIKPTQTFVDEFRWTSLHPIAFDWNCDGKVDRAYATNLNCGGLVLTGCTGGTGFKGAGPGCGSPDDYFECKGVNGVCAAAKVDTRNQLCK